MNIWELGEMYILVAGSVIEKYGHLVKQRQCCNSCDGLRNPFCVEQKYDVNEIGSLSKRKDDFDAKIVVVGQDWGDEDNYLSSEGKCDPKIFSQLI